MVSTPLKNISQNGNLPQVWMKIKKYLKPPTRKLPNQNYPSFPKNKWRRNFRLLRHHLCSIFRPHLWRQSLLGFQPREGRRAAREMVQLAVYTIYTTYIFVNWMIFGRQNLFHQVQPMVNWRFFFGGDLVPVMQIPYCWWFRNTANPLVK